MLLPSRLSNPRDRYGDKDPNARRPGCLLNYPNAWLFTRRAYNGRPDHGRPFLTALTAYSIYPPRELLPRHPQRGRASPISHLYVYPQFIGMTSFSDSIHHGRKLRIDKGRNAAAATGALRPPAIISRLNRLPALVPREEPASRHLSARGKLPTTGRW